MTENSHNSFTDLKNWFLAQAHPYTTVYRGTEVKQGQHSHKGNKGDMSSSWEDLERYLKGICRNGCQVFILCRRKDDNTSVGVSTIFDYSPYRQDSFAGIGNMTPATTQPQGLSESDVQKMIAQEREKWEQSREIEDLKGMIQGIQEDNGKTERMIKTVLNHPLVAAVGSILIAKVAGIDPSVLASLQGNASGEHDSDDEAPNDSDDDGIFNEALENFEKAGFTPDKLKKLSEWAKENKAFAHQMFSSQVNQMQ